MPRHLRKLETLGIEIPEVGMSYNRAALLLGPKPESARTVTGGQTCFRRSGCIISIVCLHEVNTRSKILG
jgi:hypothetical protein